MKRYEALTIFPEFFDTYIHSSILGIAYKNNLFEFEAYNLRDWTDNRRVDRKPAGGGQGQLMKVEPIFEAIDDISATGEKPHIVFFAPYGERFTQRTAEKLLEKDRVLFVCGRYEGIDQRALNLADQVISLGDFILTGGELPALAVIDSLVRLIPGALGNDMSAVDESFSSEGLLEYEQYTKPANYRGLKIPEVLLSGHHKNIAEWRRRNAIERTAKFRPDMIKTAPLSDEERLFAEQIIRENENNSE